MDVYRELGMEPVINGSATLTRLGGSLMPPEVLEAMRAAATGFVDMEELGRRVGEEIARLTRNEAAMISGGAAAGLVLAAAACMARDVPDGILRHEDLPSLPRRIVVQRPHRNPYQSALELPGAELREIGAEDGVAEAELATELGEGCAAVAFFAGSHLQRGTVPLERVIELAHGAGVPVVVDAAAQLPPPDNLWRFTEMGADLVVFSGGKGLCGPQSTGLVLGAPDFVGRCTANAAPLHRVGRPMKVSKEDMVGILHAVRWYLGQDHDAMASFYEDAVSLLVAWGAGRDDVRVTRAYPSEAGQPMPRARVELTGGRTADDVLAALRAGRPSIELARAGDHAMHINPQTLGPGQERLIVEALERVLAG
jgi:D-glucosaminate-6-phosphate ammonia-lyase